MTSYQIMPHLFLVRINKKEQRDVKEKISKDSPFFMPIGSVHNSRNMEHGEIMQIGEDMRGTDQINGVGIYGWEKCAVGMTLIFHHTIEANAGSKDPHYFPYFLYDDETYNYYFVDNINLRGFYDGVTVTPHPNFVFLKNIPAFPNEDDIDEVTGNKVKKTAGGIYVVTSWENSASDIAQKSQFIKERIESLTKTTRTPEIQLELEKLEGERQLMNRKAQQNKFLPYKLAFSNRVVDRNFGMKLEPNSILWCYNKAALYISNFQLEDYKYIIVPIEHIGFLYTPN